MAKKKADTAKQNPSAGTIDETIASEGTKKPNETSESISGADTTESTLDNVDEKVMCVFIRSKSPDGFRRCNTSFTSIGAYYALDYFSKEEAKIIAAEPHLFVVASELSISEMEKPFIEK